MRTRHPKPGTLPAPAAEVLKDLGLATFIAAAGLCAGPDAIRLIREYGVVLLPGGGFGTIHPSGRASLANLNESDYAKIGHALRRLAGEHHKQYEAAGAKPKPPSAPAGKKERGGRPETRCRRPVDG